MNDQRPIPMNDPGWRAAWRRVQPRIPSLTLESDVFMFGEQCFMAGRQAYEREMMAEARRRALLTSREDDRGEGAM